MRAAMAEAEVGDDVLGDDPTVQHLEARAAELVGKEEALFVPSGCMANLISVMAQTQAGAEILVAQNSHINCAEAGSYARLAQANKWPLKVDRFGRLDPGDVTAAIHVGYGRPGGDTHRPTTQLLCIENTNNYCGGTVQTPEEMEAPVAAARERAPWIKVHLDGARVFNAAVALGRPVQEFTAPVDSVSFCLSKGLGAPVGSMVCGTRAMITQARALRKMLGGGMRQVGVLAACGLLAISESNIARLAEDHAHCRRLAEGLAERDDVSIDLDVVQTNILFFSIESPKGNAEWLATALAERGVQCLAMGGRIRLVLHRDVSEEQVDFAIRAAAEILG
jgi:threonine aldolase